MFLSNPNYSHALSTVPKNHRVATNWKKKMKEPNEILDERMLYSEPGQFDLHEISASNFITLSE